MLSPSETLVVLNLIPGLGSMRIQSLLEHFGSAELVLEAPVRILTQVPRIGPKLAQAIADWRHCTNVQAEYRSAAARGARIITLIDDAYPAILRRMSDPPIVLYVLGEWQQRDARRSVAIVGTRQASAYGITQARRFGQELAGAAGCCIVSGLARGIDTAGHMGALDVGGRTIGILGSGLNHIFPPENSALADSIVRSGRGAIVSEFPMNQRPSRVTFPQRNRIVAAWSRATLVVEAPQRSGSLHTAKLAAENYGASVFALPGPVNTPGSQGCHALIRDGASLCSSPRELISDMGWNETATESKKHETGKETRDSCTGKGYQAPDGKDGHTLCLAKESGDILPPAAAHYPDSDTQLPHILPSQMPVIDAIRRGFDTLDQLCSVLGQGAGHITPLLMQLLIAHHLTTLPGGRYKALS